MNTFPSSLHSDVSTIRQEANLQILIAEDTALGCELLSEALERSRLELGRIFCAASHSQLMKIVRENNIDVALISEGLQGGVDKEIRILEQVHVTQSRTRCILLVKDTHPEVILDAFQSGAKGVLSRTEPTTVLFKCISAVHRGQIWVNSEQLELILTAFVRRPPIRIVSSNGTKLLTKREEEVASLIGEGLTNREVAERLGLRVHTVGNYLSKMYEKLGISTRVELVLYLMNQRNGQ